MTDQPYDINLVAQVESMQTVPVARLEAAINGLLAREGLAPGAGLSVVLTDDDTVRALNRQYRAVDRPTDVLSFAAEADSLPGEAAYLGDLVVALPYLRRQAAAEGHEFGDELLLAVIHGTLHLLGYDHDSPASQDAMWAVQAEALAAANVPIVVDRFSFYDEPADSGGDRPDQDREAG